MHNKQVLITHTGKSFCNTGGSIWKGLYMADPGLIQGIKLKYIYIYI